VYFIYLQSAVTKQYCQPTIKNLAILFDYVSNTFL
jgi:hypothetical protein